MADYGLHKNGEGYADPTAYDGIRGRAKPGEIYDYNGKDVLIVRNQGGYCNILTLCDFIPKENNAVEIGGRYISPGKISYAFNDRLGAYAGRITDYEFHQILNDVAVALSFVYMGEDEPAENVPDTAPPEITPPVSKKESKVQLALGILEGISYGVSERAAEGINKVIKMLEG